MCVVFVWMLMWKKKVKEKEICVFVKNKINQSENKKEKIILKDILWKLFNINLIYIVYKKDSKFLFTFSTKNSDIFSLYFFLLII